MVITNFSRTEYIRRCVESIHTHADMPFEIIINEDGSSPKVRDFVYSLQDKVSSIIFNYGVNMGLNEAANRGVSIASSKYILFMNDDSYLVRPCFQAICEALSRPYIGNLCVGNSAPDFDKGFALTNNMLGGYTIAFRKEVWKEVGGWSENCSTSQSDNVFLTKIWRAGYWKGILSGTRKIELEQFERPDTYIHTADKSIYDRSLPKLFGLDNQGELNLQRMRKAVEWDNSQKQIPAGLENLDYWFRYFSDIFRQPLVDIFDTSHIVYGIDTINWEVTEQHGQIKWKENILNDL